MKGDPVDPVTFERATRELFERFAAHEGIDLPAHYRGDDDGASDERLGQLRADAKLKLEGNMIVENLRAWTSRDGEWRRVTQEQLKAWLMNPPVDEFSGIYLDREEVAHVRPDQWTMDRHAGQTSTERPKADIGTRGRPQGSGAYNDEPFLIEMKALLKSGKARSINQAASIVAERAEGASHESKVTRLRKAYVRRWGVGD